MSNYIKIFLDGQLVDLPEGFTSLRLTYALIVMLQQTLLLVNEFLPRYLDYFCCTGRYRFFPLASPCRVYLLCELHGLTIQCRFLRAVQIACPEHLCAVSAIRIVNFFDIAAIHDGNLKVHPDGNQVALLPSYWLAIFISVPYLM